jgi:large subunit ribosomal protein L13
MQNITKSTKISDIKRVWHLVDAKDKILGRVAVDVAAKLIGKNKPYFVRSLDCGDYVVVINAPFVAVTGHKEKEKLYGNYSGFPGGLKQKALWELRRDKPEEIIKRAVMGMLPKNKLRARMIARLKIVAGSENPYQSNFAK